jgi:hypothetical protein
MFTPTVPHFLLERQLWYFGFIKNLKYNHIAKSNEQNQNISDLSSG